MSNARQVAVKVISEIERNGSFSNIAADTAIVEAGLIGAEARLASILIYGVLQRKITLDYFLKEVAGKGFGKTHPFVLSVLRVGAYQLLFTDKIPPSAAVNESVKIIKQSKQNFAAGFVNAVLRKINTNHEDILNSIKSISDISVKYSVSKKFADGLIKDYGRKVAEDFLSASLESPKLFCRVNHFAENENLFNELSENGITVESAELEDAFTLKGVGNIEQLENFNKGELFVQDLASQTAISSFEIKNGMSVLDVCAAPGGKSFTAAQFVGQSGKIVSLDLYEKRVGLIKSGAERLKITNISTKQNDATVFNSELGLFDRVICDVPCSGFGVIRRKPEIKYKDVSEFVNLPEIQLKILETSVKYLKPNGMIMYSTCTLRKAENRQVVDKFLVKNNDFDVVSERTLMPQTDGTDGFYYLILKRKLSD